MRSLDRLAELLAGIVWWWNPLFWFARRRSGESAEIACDALAVGTLPAGRRAYAEAFLELSLPPRIHRTWAPALGVGSRDRKSFERRLSMILSPHVVGKLSWPGLLAVAVLAIVAIPSWSPGQVDPPSAVGPQSDSTTPDTTPATAVPDTTPLADSGVPDTTPVAEKADTTQLPGPASRDGQTSGPKSTFYMNVNSSIEIAWPNTKISRGGVGDPTILAFMMLTENKVQLSATKVGATELRLWDENGKVNTILVVVQADAPKSDPYGTKHKVATVALARPKTTTVASVAQEAAAGRSDRRRQPRDRDHRAQGEFELAENQSRALTQANKQNKGTITGGAQHGRDQATYGCAKTGVSDQDCPNGLRFRPRANWTSNSPPRNA